MADRIVEYSETDNNDSDQFDSFFSNKNLHELNDITLTTPENGHFLKYSGGQWVNSIGSGAGISNVVEDTTPQAGGDFDMNGHNLFDGTRDNVILLNELYIYRTGGTAVDMIHLRENNDTADYVIRWNGSNAWEFRSETDGGGNVYTKIGTNGKVYYPLVYDDIVDSPRVLTIKSDGQIGYDQYDGCSFRVTQNNSQHFQSTEKLNWNSEQYDTHNRFDLGTDEFTAPVHGIYHFDCCILSEEYYTFWGTWIELEIYVNGSREGGVYHYLEGGETDYIQLCLTTDLELSAGDKVDMRVQSDDSIELYRSHDWNWWNGHLVKRLS